MREGDKTALLQMKFIGFYRIVIDFFVFFLEDLFDGICLSYSNGNIFEKLWTTVIGLPLAVLSTIFIVFFIFVPMKLMAKFVLGWKFWSPPPERDFFGEEEIEVGAAVQRKPVIREEKVDWRNGF